MNHSAIDCHNGILKSMKICQLRLILQSVYVNDYMTNNNIYPILNLLSMYYKHMCYFFVMIRLYNIN